MPDLSNQRGKNNILIEVMKKLLITGASGFLGWHLANFARENYEVYGTYGQNSVESNDFQAIKLDITDFQALKQIFTTIKPDGVIHTAALSKPNFCQTYPDESYRVNVEGSVNIAQLCAELAIPLAFTSTDLVFDGLNPPYDEKSPISPICTYGEHKAIAESKMLAIYPKTAICRMPLMYGEATPKANSFLQDFVQTLKEGKQLSLFIDEYRTPVDAKSACQGLILSLNQVSGIIHLGGKEKISRYQFGLLMAEIFDFDAKLITPCRQQDVKMSAPRSPDTSMNSSLAYSLGYNPSSIKDDLLHLKL